MVPLFLLSKFRLKMKISQTLVNSLFNWITFSTFNTGLKVDGHICLPLPFLEYILDICRGWGKRPTHGIYEIQSFHPVLNSFSYVQLSSKH